MNTEEFERILDVVVELDHTSMKYGRRHVRSASGRLRVTDLIPRLARRPA